MSEIYKSQTKIQKIKGDNQMKNFKRRSFLSFTILAILLAQLFGGTVLALGYEAPAEQEIVVEEIIPMMASASCDVYGTDKYTTLQEAINAYGDAFEYKSCNPFEREYKGVTYYYNYYYIFTDGSRMYFGVWP